MMTNTNRSSFKPSPVTKLPYRLEAFGGIGWTVTEFKTAADAAAFFTAHRNAEMPCWRRMDIINGELILARP